MLSAIHSILGQSNKATWILSLVVIGLLAFNLWYVLSGLHRVNPAVPNQPILTLPNGDLLLGDISTVAPETTAREWPLVISVGFMALFAGGLSLFNILLLRKAKLRDTQRLTDLMDLKSSLEAYHSQHGSYPLPQATPTRSDLRVLVPTEWSKRGLPDGAEMNLHLGKWPIHDPLVSPDQPDQTGAYVYYPDSSGQSFKLYALLERPTAKAEDLEQDELPEELELYNYCLVSEKSSPSSQASQADTPIRQAIGPWQPARIQHAKPAESSRIVTQLDIEPTTETSGEIDVPDLFDQSHK